MAGNKINFEVGFQINQSNLTQLQNSLNQVMTTANNAKASGKLTSDLREASTIARQLSSILSSSFNKDLGTLNIEKFNAGLKQANLTLDQVKAKLSAQGSLGATAFNRLSSSILSTNVQLQQSNKFLNDMATTMANTLKWGVASSILNTMAGSIRNAYSYTKQLDSSLTSIRVVTGDSADEMSRFAEQANTAAKSLGSTTLDYTKSALSFYQQGLGDEAVAERTEATIKAANVTGSRAEEVAENLTAVWNGFQAQIGTETDYVDKLAAVADSSASNLAELATAMSKVASVGNNVGVNMDQLTAQISTIIATTRQAPETVGNALKTIYARINDIKTGADGAEISLGNYTTKMESLGISVLDSNNNLRDTGEVFEEIGAKWSGMTREQQIYLAQTMAGQRQMNNLIALFDNWGKYSDMLNVSLEAQGTLDEKNARYLESVQAHLNTLKSTWQDLYSTILDTDELNTGIDTITNFVSMFDSFLESFGGGIKSVAAFGTMVAFVFREQIGQALGNMINNQNIAKSNFEQLQLQAQAAQMQAASTNTISSQAQAAGLQSQQQNMQAMLAVQRGLTQEQQQQLISMQTEIGYLREQEQIQTLTLEQKRNEYSLDEIRRTEQQGYLAGLADEYNQTSNIAVTEEDIISILRQRVQEEKNLIIDGETELEQKERVVQAQYELNRALAAQKADQAELAAQRYGGEASRIQGEHDAIIRYASVITMAKARTDMLLGSLTLLTVGFGAVKGAVNILNDETASAGEKLGRLAMLASTMGPMIAMAFIKAHQGVIAYGTALKTQVAEAAAAALANKANAAALELANASGRARLKILHEIHEAEAEGILITGTYNAVINGETKELDENTLALIADVIGIKAESKAAGEGVAPNLAFGEALGFVGKQAGKLLLSLLPYIAVAAAVAGAIAAVYLEYTKYDRAAEKAAEASNNLKQAVKDAKDEFNSAKQSLNSYTEAKAALADLTEGTKEWKMQVMEVNQQVLALLQEYPQLAQYIKNTNGVLEITAGGVDVLMNDLIEKQNKLMAASLSASAAAQQASIDAKAVNISRQAGGGDDTTHYNHKEGTYYDMPSFSGDKETIEGLASAINNFPDAMGNVMKMSEASEEEIAAAIRDQMKSNSDLAQSFEGLDIDTMANAIKDNSSGLYELASSMVALNGTADLIAQSLVDSIDDGYKSKQDYDQLSEGDKKVVDAIIGGKVGAGGEIRKQAEEELQSQGLTSHEELKKAYLDTYGGTEAQAADMNVDALREAIITDIERRILADDGGLEAAIDRSDEITSALKNQGVGLDTSSKSALASYLEGGTIDVFRNLSDADLNQLLNIDDETLRKLDLSDEKIKELKTGLDQIKENNGSNAPVLDFDVDAQELEQLTNELQNTSEEDEVFSENLRTNAVLAQEVAESILRYKDAISDLSENYDDWYDILDDGDPAEIFDELQDAYGDLLDIDGSQLSEDFLSDVKNLQDMKDALEGDEEAYNRLADAATEDIIAHLDIENVDQDQLSSVVQDIQNYCDTNPAWLEVKVGDLVIDDNLASQFEQFANTCGLYGQEAIDAFNSAFASQGIQAEIDEDGTPVQQDMPAMNNIQGHIQQEHIENPVFTSLGDIFTVGADVVTGITYDSNTVKGGTTKLKSGGYGVKFRKSANGGVKHNAAKNFGSSTPKSRGGGGGGGGKGGKGKKGGGGKKVEPPKKKEIKKDPYHDVNRQLGIVEDNLKKLQKEEKKLTGKQYLNNLVKQNQQLEKQRKLIKQKADIATQEVKRQQQELAKNYGFGFNSDGDISNYFSVLAKYQKQVEDLYNKAQKNPSETNNAKYQKATEDYDAMMKAIDAYEKDLDIYNKQIQDDQDALNDMIENNIKRFNYTIDLHLDTADFEKDLKEFRRDVLDQIKEDDYINLSSYGLSMGKDTLADARELVQHVKDIQNAIKEMQKGNYNASPYHDNMNSAMEDLQKYTEELMKRGEDIADIQDDIHDNWMDAIDAAQDAFDEQQDEYDQINDLIEHNLDMLEMLHGDEAYGQMANLYQQQADNSIRNIQLLAKERDFWFQQMNSVAEGSDAWKEYRDNWEDAVKDLNSSIKDAADYFYNRYEAIFNQLAKQLKDTFAGGDWNKRQTLWEDFLDDDDRYLDSLSRANGTYNLIQKTQEAIGNANLKHQKELNKWLDATTKNLESQTELRQIDLDIAEKELDIILKRQALEDAQNNKTKMRLRRDSQGNYRYQYVADTNDVAQKQQELRDAIEDLRLLVKEDFKDTVDRMYDQMDSFAEEAADISEKYGFNTEEWNDQMALLQERYIKKTTKTANDYAEMMRKLSQATGVEATELFGQMGDEFMAALGMDSDTYKVFEQMFKPGGEYVDLIDGFITEIYTSSFDGVAEDVKDTFNEVTNLLPAAVADLGNNLGERIRDMLAQFMSDASDNQQEYVKNLEDVQNETGQHFDDLTTNMEGTIQATEDLLLDNDKLISSYGEVINKVQEFADAIAKVVEQYKALSEAQINSTANTILGNGYYQNGTNGVARYGVNGEDIRSIDENVDSMTQVLRQLSSYDEGGWTNGGGAELAVVHPNEYVLTSQDAPNMLAAAQIASRVMDRVADLKAAAMSQVGGAIGGLFTAVANANENNMSEQQIIINADFPAVESAREIKQAFNELVNLASQRASGNRRTY